MLEVETEFEQAELIESYNKKSPPSTIKGGMCFRLSFKWAACKIKGATFKNYDLNLVKSHQKHSEYRVKSKAVEATANFSLPGVFNKYVEDDVNTAKDYVDKWGMKFTTKSGGTKTVYNNAVKVKEIIEKKVDIYLLGEKNNSLDTLSFIYGFYGQDGGAPAGHATAFCRGRFFDPNVGECSSTKSTHAAVGDDILTFVTLAYPWAQRHFIFVLEDSGGTQTTK